MNSEDFNFWIENIEVIKTNYIRFLSPFLDQEVIIRYKKMLYSCNVAEWQKDKVWEFLNDDLDYQTFLQIAKHFKK